MTIARHYVMQAAAGQEDILAAALAALADGVVTLPGCGGAELLRDIAEPGRFIFIETWESVAAHKEAGRLLPKVLMAPVMAALASPPAGSYLARLTPA